MIKLIILVILVGILFVLYLYYDKIFIGDTEPKLIAAPSQIVRKLQKNESSEEDNEMTQMESANDIITIDSLDNENESLEHAQTDFSLSDLQ